MCFRSSCRRCASGAGISAILAAAVRAKNSPRTWAGRSSHCQQDCIRRLEAYRWPGNVRELQNIIERAVITSRDRKLNLDRALPESVGDLAVASAGDEAAAKRVRTAKELEDLERENIVAALEASDWKVAGANGAATLLGIKPTTLSSRMKALGIERKR